MSDYTEDDPLICPIWGSWHKLYFAKEVITYEPFYTASLELLDKQLYEKRARALMSCQCGFVQLSDIQEGK